MVRGVRINLRVDSDLALFLRPLGKFLHRKGRIEQSNKSRKNPIECEEFPRITH